MSGGEGGLENCEKCDLNARKTAVKTTKLFNARLDCLTHFIKTSRYYIFFHLPPPPPSLCIRLEPQTFSQETNEDLECRKKPSFNSSRSLALAHQPHTALLAGTAYGAQTFLTTLSILLHTFQHSIFFFLFAFLDGL